MQKFRHDINGLRAIAVVAVIIYHLRPTMLVGGFIGVDIFFVLSGYLISNIIWNGLNKGNFSLKNFYYKRVQRIFPALIAIIVITIISALLILPLDILFKVAETAKFSSLQISNFYFADTVDYFSIDNDFSENPLLHTWSLGIEEQFYLFWPLLLILFHKKLTKKTTIAALIFIIFISIFTSEYWLATNSEKTAFYLLPSRIWEFTIGGLIIFIPQLKSFKKPLLSLGVTLIISSFFFIDSNSFPGTSAIAPCLGTALIIYAGMNKEHWFSKLSRNRLIYFLGVTSYSAYLIHIPLIVFYTSYVGRNYTSALEAGIIIITTFILAYFSWKYIENTFRYNKHKQKAIRCPIVLLLIIILLALLSGWIETQAGSKQSQLKNMEELSFIKGDINFTIPLNGNPNPFTNVLHENECIYNDPEKFNKKSFYNLAKCDITEKINDSYILLMGNSHVYHPIYGLQKLAKENSLGLAVMEVGNLYQNPVIQQHAHELYIKKSVKYVAWSSRHDTNPNYFDDLYKMAKNISNSDKKLILIGQVPHFSVNIYRCLEGLGTKGKTSSCIIQSTDAVLDESFQGNKILKEIADTYQNVYFWDPTPYFCDKKTCSSLSPNKTLIYRPEPYTSNHLNIQGIVHISKFIEKDLSPIFK